MDFLKYEVDDAAASSARDTGLPEEQRALRDPGRGPEAPPASDEGQEVPNAWRRKNTIWRRGIERRQQHLFHQFVENTTLHGVKYVTNPNHSKPRRLIWVFLFGTMLIIVSCAVSAHLVWYFKYPTKMAITHRSPAKTSFPSVAMCNCNRFRVHALNGSRWADLVPMMDSAADFRSGAERRRLGRILSNVSDEQARRIGGADFRQLGMELTREFKSMLLDCRWEGGQRCSAADFTLVWTDFGVCHVFNWNDANAEDQGDDEGLTVNTTGIDGGLWVRLNVQQSDNSAVNTRRSCFKVAIKPRGELYFVRDVERTVEPGSHSIIGLRKQVRTSLEAPYETKCRKDGLKYFKKYSIGACRLECLTDDTIEKCGCIAPFMPETPFCECATPCSEVLFDERVSNAKAPSHDIETELQLVLNRTTEEASESILEISIYFEDLREQWTTHEAAYGIVDLMSSIGGELGLCLGGSVITVFEFADFLFTRQALHLRLFKTKLNNVGRLKRPNQPV